MRMDTVRAVAEAVAARLFVPVEASGRHVHLTRAQAQALFGHALTPARPLSQPGQFLANERVTVSGPKGELRHVAVLGPERSEAQVELSLTDGRAIGVALPVRLSGDTVGSPGVTLKTDRQMLVLESGAIAAQRHVHLPPADAGRLGVRDGQTVSVRLDTARPLVFTDVAVRVSASFAPAVHIDYDEANACGFRSGDLGRLLP